MKFLRIVLIVANSGASAFLLALPAGKLLGLIDAEVDNAAVIGWLIFFAPVIASALALCGVHLSWRTVTGPFVIIAMPGSFLVALLSLYTFWQGPSEFALIGIFGTSLFALNVLALWEPFLAHLRD